MRKHSTTRLNGSGSQSIAALLERVAIGCDDGTVKFFADGSIGDSVTLLTGTDEEIALVGFTPHLEALIGVSGSSLFVIPVDEIRDGAKMKRIRFEKLGIGCDSHDMPSSLVIGNNVMAVCLKHPGVDASVFAAFGLPDFEVLAWFEMDYEDRMFVALISEVPEENAIARFALMGLDETTGQIIIHYEHEKKGE